MTPRPSDHVEVTRRNAAHSPRRRTLGSSQHHGAIRTRAGSSLKGKFSFQRVSSARRAISARVCSPCAAGIALPLRVPATGAMPSATISAAASAVRSRGLRRRPGMSVTVPRARVPAQEVPSRRATERGGREGAGRRQFGAAAGSVAVPAAEVADRRIRPCPASSGADVCRRLSRPRLTQLARTRSSGVRRR